MGTAPSGQRRSWEQILRQTSLRLDQVQHAPGGPSGEDPSTGSTTEEPWDDLQHVHIEIDNFCQVSVDPPEIHVPVDETVTLSYHNHSVDYEADVWLSYGGGYLELELGKTWDDPFEWCTGPDASTGYADISIAGGGDNFCPKQRMKIHCE